METAPTSSERINILLVDDRPENIYVLKEVLKRPDYNLVVAASGAEALGHLLRQDFALILLDVFMPEMDGFEVVTAIKQREKTKHIPIIFLTAMNKDLSNVYKAYSHGVVDYLQKPLEAHIVRAKVEVFAELFRKSQQVKRYEIREREYQLQEVRRLGERRYMDLVEGIDHGIVWSADPRSLTFTYVSPRAEIILGYPLQQWITEHDFWAKHVHEDDRDMVLERFKKAQEGQDLGFEHRFIRHSGDTAWFHTGVRLARKGEGAGYELRGLSVDVTAMKDIEQALREAVRVRDEFLSIASHELKTPLTPLKMRIDILIRHLKKKDFSSLSREQTLKIAETCSSQIQRVTKLVDNLLDVSRIRSGKIILNREKVDLAELIKEVALKYCDFASTGQICNLKVEHDQPIIGYWDKHRLEQVLVNLLTNAAKYGKGMPIDLGCSASNKTAQILIQDRGIGIAPEDQKRIFDRFERAISASDFAYSGLGLGLYITRQIVEAHEGQIQIQSELSKGTTFIIELPLEESKIRKDIPA